MTLEEIEIEEEKVLKGIRVHNIHLMYLTTWLSELEDLKELAKIEDEKRY